MACERSITFTIPGTSTSPALQITAVENAGKIDFTVDVQDNAQLTADLRGLFFHLADEFKLSRPDLQRWWRPHHHIPGEGERRHQPR